MRLISGAVAGLVLVGSLTQVAQAQPVQVDDTTTPQAEAVDVSSTAVPAVSGAAAAQAERSDADAADLVAALPARSTDDFGLVGVTWAPGFDDTGMTVQVRLRTDGEWSSWEELHVDSDAGEGGRDGTEPLWTDSADGVAVRVTSPTGERPSGLAVSTVDPGTTATEASTGNASTAFYDGTAATATAVADGSPSFTSKPAIISRASWGARKNTYCDNPRTGDETRGVVVHHTAGSNSYSKSQSASIVRAVQAYHMSGRDWCDIGYNFLVDKYGQIFEGRTGGTDRPVRAAHAGDKSVNTYTMGVSMMGTYTSSGPTTATKDAMVKLIGWRLGTTYHPATGTYRVGSYTLNRIAGHRNVVSTECPGVKAYAWLTDTGSSGLRTRVASYISGFSSASKREAQRLGAAKTGPVFIGEYGITGGRKVRMKLLDIYSVAAGVFSVGGEYRSVYTTLTSQAGPLGAPTGNAEATSRDVVSLQRFDHGTIYRVRRTSSTDAYALWGATYLKYKSLGEASGSLGAPTKGQTKISGGRYRAYFFKGYITREANGTITVTAT